MPTPLVPTTRARWIPTLVAVVAVAVLALSCSEPGPRLRLPTAPTDVFVMPGDGHVSLTWSLGRDGGSPIENHAYSLDDGATWTEFDPPRVDGFGSIDGLTNGVVHALRLRAVNSVGAGPASVAVSAVAAVPSYLLTIDSPADVSVTGAVGLADGSVVVTGSARGETTFADLVTLPAVTGRRALVARVDADGAWSWVRTIASDMYVGVFGVVALGGTAVVTGEFVGTVVIEGHGTLEAHDLSLFVARIDASGAWLWVSVASGGTSGGVEGASIAADHAGGIVVVTNVFGAVTFGDAGTVTAQASLNGAVAHIDADGAWSWAVGTSGTVLSLFGDVAVAADGQILVAGLAYGGDAIDGLPPIDHAGTEGVLVAGLDPGGTWSWALGAAGSGGVVNAVTTGADGTVYVGGFVGGDATFGALPELTVAGLRDGFIAAIDGERSWAWVTSLGSSSVASVSDLVVTASGILMAVGTFSGMTAFGDAGFVPSGSTAGFQAYLAADGAWGWRDMIDSSDRIGRLIVSRAAGDGVVVAGDFAGTLLTPNDNVAAPPAGVSNGFVMRSGTVIF